MVSSAGYMLVKLANGIYSTRSIAVGETCHPVVGPVAEAEALYVRQLRLLERVERHAGEFVLWDVGLGAGANVLTVLRATRSSSTPISVVSFDHTLEPLRFSLGHAAELGYFGGYELPARDLLTQGAVGFSDGARQVRWQVRVADFPSLIGQPTATQWPPPDAIMFDAYSPAKNPAMWTQPLFARLYRLLDPRRPCAMATYSRSTMLRVAWLLAGFYVGAGHATGEKEETTIAANSLALIDHPLGRRWLLRARRSTSAEPLWEPVYRQARLLPETWAKLEAHPQFAG